jgi:hypothetical protein
VPSFFKAATGAHDPIRELIPSVADKIFSGGQVAHKSSFVPGVQKQQLICAFCFKFGTEGMV